MKKPRFVVFVNFHSIRPPRMAALSIQLNDVPEHSFEKRCTWAHLLCYLLPAWLCSGDGKMSSFLRCSLRERRWHLCPVCLTFVEAKVSTKSIRMNPESWHKGFGGTRLYKTIDNTSYFFPPCLHFSQSARLCHNSIGESEVWIVQWHAPGHTN